MATPEPKIRDAIKRMPSHDNDRGQAYMRGDVLVHVLDCRRLTHPKACEVFDQLTSTDRLEGHAHLSPIQLADRFQLPLDEARILWKMIVTRPSRVQLTKEADPA